jgi:transketolase C-terminal domain/subunit
MTGPVYLRIDKSALPNLPGLDGRFTLSTPELVRGGNDLMFVTTGSLSAEVLRAAQLVERRVSAAVAVMAHLANVPSESLVRLLQDYATVITAEEGYIAGGLGSLVAAAIATRNLRCRLVMQGVRELCAGASGSVEYLRKMHGLDAESLAALALQLIPMRLAA